MEWKEVLKTNWNRSLATTRVGLQFFGADVRLMGEKYCNRRAQPGPYACNIFSRIYVETHFEQWRKLTHEFVQSDFELHMCTSQTSGYLEWPICHRWFLCLCMIDRLVPRWWQDAASHRPSNTSKPLFQDPRWRVEGACWWQAYCIGLIRKPFNVIFHFEREEGACLNRR